MGACASTPKTLGDNAAKVPVPEQPKEETTTTSEAVVVADKAVEEVKVEQEEVKTEKQEKSLGSLLESNEEVKKDAVEEPKGTAAPAPALEEKKEEASAAESKKE